ncbi:hypothetical protein JW916_11890 [Candidatus Sumerlaeota bacterium]|nr:hypothetical protein [Candidatus Sumerlaeota bacterium]
MSHHGPKVPLEERIALCQEFAKEWAEYFNFFGDGFEGRKITAESEAQFFRTMTDLARKQFRLEYFLGEDLQSADKITALLSESVSLVHIHGMSEAQFSQFQLKWHVIYIALNKCLGRLIARRPVSKEAKRKLILAATIASRKSRMAKAAQAEPPPQQPQQAPPQNPQAPE